MNKAKFWLALGAERRNMECGGKRGPIECWLNGKRISIFADPHNAEEVTTDVLLDGLERLAWEYEYSEIAVWSMDNSLTGSHRGYRVDAFDPVNYGGVSIVGSSPDRRTAIIAAICKLAGIGMEGK